MIRSPQAFLVSLSLHLLMGLAVFYFVVPKFASTEIARTERCRISLSQVLPALEEIPASEKRCAAKPKTEKRKTASAEPNRVTAPVKQAETVVVPVEEVVMLPETEMMPVTETGEATEEPVHENVSEAVTHTAEPVMSESETLRQPAQNGATYLQEHLRTIVQLLREYLYYPRMARKRHIEGEVLAVFTLETDGSIHGVAIKKHSRDILDRAAVQTIESLSGLMPHPENALTLEVPIRFVLK